MIITGLTGGIGSGKTTVARIFESLGVPVYYADAEARKCYVLPEVIAAVKNIFGNGVFSDAGKLLPDELARLAFADAEKLQQLNTIIHPLVMADFKKWAHRFQDKKMIILESAILFETGLNKGFDKIIVVDAPKELCIRRVMQRDSISEAAVLSRMQRQMEPAQKVGLADLVIINDDKTAVLPQVQRIYEDMA